MSTAKLTELPLRSTISLAYHPPSALHFRFFFCSCPRHTFSIFKSFSSLRSSTEFSGGSRNPRTGKDAYPWDDEPLNPARNPNPSQQKPKASSAQWLNKWPSPNPPIDSDSRAGDMRRGNDRTESRYFDGRSGTTAIERIVLRLRNLGLGSDDEEEEDEEKGNENLVMSVTGEEKLGDLLRRDWVRPDKMLFEGEDNESWLPWERAEESGEGADENGGNGRRKKAVRAPTLAELTIEDEELRRLRRQGMTLRERINVPKAGVTAAVLKKIHEQWRRSELVRLKFHEILAHDMKTAHEIVEVGDLMI